MDAESVRSGKSDRSGRYAMHAAGSPKRGNGPPSRPPPPPPADDRDSDPADGSSAVGAAPPAPPRPGHGHHRRRSRDHHQRAVPARADAGTDDRESRDVPAGDDAGGPGEPGDDDTWMETTTAVTTTTFSEAGFSSVENMSRLNKNLALTVGFACARYVDTLHSALIGLLAYVSPILMIVLPKTGLFANMTLSADGTFQLVTSAFLQCFDTVGWVI